MDISFVWISVRLTNPVHRKHYQHPTQALKGKQEAAFYYFCTQGQKPLVTQRLANPFFFMKND
jgi:hypothetical protein